MKKALPLLALFVTTASAENLIDRLLNYKPNNINVDGMQMRRVESTIVPGTFYYKMVNRQTGHNTINPNTIKSLNRKLISEGYNNIRITQTPDSENDHTPMTPEQIETAKLAVARQQAEIEMRNKIQPKQAIKESRDLVYGEGGVIQDPHVLEAWRAADEAQKRLEEHREYMKRVRESKTSIEKSKKNEAGLETVNLPETS